LKPVEAVCDHICQPQALPEQSGLGRSRLHRSSWLIRRARSLGFARDAVYDSFWSEHK
jgi:hypothetical protein